MQTKLQQLVDDDKISLNSAQLIDALARCVLVTRQWHGTAVFEIYYNHSPELFPVRWALADFGFTLADILAGECFLLESKPRI